MSEQGSLFDTQTEGNEILQLPQADLRLIPNFLSFEESQQYQHILRSSIHWEHSTIQMYGKAIKIPRLNAWYGDKHSDYHYSGAHFKPLPWTTPLLEIKSRIEALIDARFNSVLLNCYRDGNDSVAWHSDDEKELGETPLIASLSLGQTRSFHLRHKANKALGVYKLALTSGSLLIMGGTTQRYWQHQIPKTRKTCDERINLTFRWVFS